MQGPDLPMNDSRVRALDPAHFHIFKCGQLTVIGFEGQHLTQDRSLEECRESLVDIVREHNCQLLAVDLMEIGLVTSWVLAVLVAVHNLGIEVHLYHPNQDVRDLLEITHLDELLNIRKDLISC